MWKKRVLWISMLVFIASCAINPVTGKRELMLVSEEEEIQIGREYYLQISAIYGIYNDEQLLNYVDGIGQKMAKISHRPDLKYEIKVMDSPVINAFAVPGGYVYITRGILAYLNNEAELAGVVGHEIGHITARHSAKQMSKAQLAQVGLGLGSIFSETFAQYAGLAEQGIGLLFLKYSRDNERQSDDLGVEYSTEVSYDATEMANFFKVLDQVGKRGSSGNSLPDWFSTHPNPADRVVDVKKEAQKLQKKYPNKNFVVNRDQYLQQINGIVYGPDPRQGFVEQDVFYHPELRFQFPTPAGWKVNNLPSQVQMISSDEKAVMVFRIEEAKATGKAASDFVQKNQLTVVSQKDVKVNGAPATELVARVQTQNGILQLLATFIEYNDNVYGFLGYTMANDFGAYESAFRNTMFGFDALRDRSKLNRQPDRIRIKEAPRAGTLGEVLTALAVPADAQADHALLNGAIQLTDQVARGYKLKIVEKGN